MTDATNSLIARPDARADTHTAQPGLQGKRAIVTGGTTGIGRAIAMLLAGQGAKVHVCGRDAQHLDDALQAPVIFAVPMQLLAYHVAVLKGTDVDQPRNLAKSLTVE